VPLRDSDLPYLEQIRSLATIKVDPDKDLVEIKTNLLLQAHFDRQALPVDLGED